MADTSDQRRPVRFVELFRTLVAHEVDFVVVGDVAAVLEGAPVSTFDLGVVYSRAESQIEALSQALLELETIYLDPAGRRIEPTASRLAAGGHHLLRTRFGRLDVMATVGDDRTFEDLADLTVTHDVHDLQIRVLQLAAVIETKQESNRPKDRAALPLLRRTLEQRDRR